MMRNIILLMGLAAFLFSCTIEDTRNQPRSDNTLEVPEGEKIYNQFCAQCHGKDGKPTLDPNIADLSASILEKSELVDVITNGRGDVMMPYKKTLTETQISDVADYVLTLRK